jgi:hypothetical protein
MTDIFPKIKALPQVESVEYGGGADGIHRFSVFAAKVTSLEEVFHELTKWEGGRQ